MSDEKKDGGDHLHILGKNGDDVLAVRCGAEGRELTTLRPVKDGRPVEELVRLSKTVGHVGRYDVETLYKAAAKPPPSPAPSGTKLGHAGPTRVSSEAYRDGWENIFGAKKPEPSVLN